MEASPDRLNSLTAGVHIMRIQSPGFWSDSGIVIKLRLDLVLGFHAPCHVKLTSLRDSTPEYHVQGSKLDFGGSVIIKEETFSDFR